MLILKKGPELSLYGSGCVSAGCIIRVQYKRPCNGACNGNGTPKT